MPSRLVELSGTFATGSSSCSGRCDRSDSHYRASSSHGAAVRHNGVLVLANRFDDRSTIRCRFKAMHLVRNAGFPVRYAKVMHGTVTTKGACHHVFHQIYHYHTKEQLNSRLRDVP